MGNPVYLARITYCFIFRVKEFTLAKKTVHAGSWDTLFLKKKKIPDAQALEDSSLFLALLPRLKVFLRALYM